MQLTHTSPVKCTTNCSDRRGMHEAMNKQPAHEKWIVLMGDVVHQEIRAIYHLLSINFPVCNVMYH